MDQEGPRTKFNKNFYEFVKPIVLNDVLLNSLEKHYAFGHIMEDIKKFDCDMARKCRIFGEFTLVRDNARRLVDMLQKSGNEANIAAATKLNDFNLSEKQMDYIYNITIPVEIGTSIYTDNSQQEKMHSDPRGEAHIFVTIKELNNLAKRYEQIFQRFLFNCKVHNNNPTINDINETLKVIANKPGRDYKGNALIVMYLGHGSEEKIVDNYRKGLDIYEIVNLFNNNCKALLNKPKMFIFDCCRGGIPTQDLNQFRSQFGMCRCNQSYLSCPKCEAIFTNTTRSFNNDFKITNEKTYVVYSCAQGFQTSYIDKLVEPIGHVTIFGQAFSHTIAQYASYKCLYQLLRKTITRVVEDKTLTEDHRPEIRMLAVQKDIYFNPGLYIDENNEVKRKLFIN